MIEKVNMYHPDKVTIENKEIFYKDIADYVKEYINSLGGFEKFAEWGIQY